MFIGIPVFGSVTPSNVSSSFVKPYPKAPPPKTVARLRSVPNLPPPFLGAPLVFLPGTPMPPDILTAAWRIAACKTISAALIAITAPIKIEAPVIKVSLNSGLIEFQRLDIIELTEVLNSSSSKYLPMP